VDTSASGNLNKELALTFVNRIGHQHQAVKLFSPASRDNRPFNFDELSRELGVFCVISGIAECTKARHC
jgi:hypothetical protein